MAPCLLRQLLTQGVDPKSFFKDEETFVEMLRSIAVAGRGICVFFRERIIRFDDEGCIEEGAVGCSAAEKEAADCPDAFAVRFGKRRESLRPLDIGLE